MEGHLLAAKQIIKEERSKGAAHDVEVLSSLLASRDRSKRCIQKVQSAHEELIRTLQSQVRDKERDFKLLKVRLRYVFSSVPSPNSPAASV